MKIAHVILVCTAITGAPPDAVSQYVKGNEAVKLLPDGSRRVETPAIPDGTLAKPCPAKRDGCAGGGWKMVETKDGLMECTEIYARPGTCRASTYGSEKRARLWIVLVNSQWMQCQHPDIGSKCVSTKSLPIAVVQ